MRGYPTKRRSEMRFVIHCALLLSAFVGLASVVDRWTTPVPDDELAALGGKQLDSSDEAYVALHHANIAKNELHLQPFFLVVLGLATAAFYRPGWLRLSKFTLRKRVPERKEGRA
jgi:hypothetical protein